jgi:hypothetical protein
MFTSARSVLIPVGGPPAGLLCVLDPIVRRWMAQNVNSRHLPSAFVMEQVVVANAPPHGDASPPVSPLPVEDVCCDERLGGLLKHYYRLAA